MKKNLFYIFSIIILMITIGIYFWKFNGELSDDSNTWGNFGDYFGGIFSALAFIAIIYSMYTERNRYEEQKKNQN